MPQLLAEPSLGNTGVKGNLFFRNRLNEYIRILTCSGARQNKSFKGERGGGELINRQMDRRTDGWTTMRTRNQENRTEKRKDVTNTTVNKKLSIRKERKGWTK
jgi:hypothetical protein